MAWSNTGRSRAWWRCHEHACDYAAASNPKQIDSLQDLERPEVRLSMPNPEWKVWRTRVKDRTSMLTEVHHRQTPMMIMGGKADRGWSGLRLAQQQVSAP
jgi:hypothetical protein